MACFARWPRWLTKEFEIREAHTFGEGEDLSVEGNAFPLEILDVNILGAAG